MSRRTYTDTPEPRYVERARTVDKDASGDVIEDSTDIKKVVDSSTGKTKLYLVNKPSIIIETTETENITIGGESYLAPKLTADDIVDVYNAIVAGQQVVIVDPLGMTHFNVIEAIAMDEHPQIVIMYFALAILTYKEEDESIVVKEL